MGDDEDQGDKPEPRGPALWKALEGYLNTELPQLHPPTDDEGEPRKRTPEERGAALREGTPDLVGRVGSFPTPGGLFPLLFALFFFLFAIVPSGPNGESRLLLIWRALTGGVRLPPTAQSQARANATAQAQAEASATSIVQGWIAAGEQAAPLWDPFWGVLDSAAQTGAQLGAQVGGQFIGLQ